MKNLKNFNDFVNESILNTQLDQLISEGALAKKADDLDISLGDIEPEDKEYEELYDAIATALDSTIRNVIFVDSETNEDDPLQSKIYNYLSGHFSAKDAIETKSMKTTHGWSVMRDPKLNVVKLDDYGFTAFYFTTNSNF